MQVLIWLTSVLLGFLCSFCWSVGVFGLALPAVHTLPIVAGIAPLSLLVSFLALVTWVAGLMMLWKGVIYLTERLVTWISPDEGKKKKKGVPLPDEHSI